MLKIMFRSLPSQNLSKIQIIMHVSQFTLADGIEIMYGYLYDTLLKLWSGGFLPGLKKHTFHYTDIPHDILYSIHTTVKLS